MGRERERERDKEIERESESIRSIEIVVMNLGMLFRVFPLPVKCQVNRLRRSITFAIVDVMLIAMLKCSCLLTSILQILRLNVIVFLAESGLCVLWV